MVKSGSLSLWCCAALAAFFCCTIALADDKSDYFEAAGYLTDHYQGDSHSRLLKPPGRLLDAPTDPSLQNAIKLAEDGAQQAQRLAGLADRAQAQAMEDLKSDIEGAVRGDYSHDERQYAGRIGGQAVYKDVSVDDGLGVVFFSALRYGLVTAKSAEAKAAETSARMMAREGGRVRAWATLLPDWPDRFAGPPINQPLLTVAYRADVPAEKERAQHDSSDELPGSYLATNTSGRDLHNVTFAAELFHYSTLPDPCLRQVYFVKDWPAGQSLALERIFFIDTRICRTRYFVMATEPPNGAFGLPDVSPELKGMGGMVRVRLTVWSTEAKQPAMLADIPERQAAVADKLLAFAQEHLCKSGPRIELSDTPMSREIQKLKALSTADPAQRGLFSRTPAAKSATIPAKPNPISPAEALKRHMERIVGSLPLFLPNGSEQLARANELLANPQANRGKVLKEREARYVAACSPGKSYTTRTMGLDPVLHTGASEIEFTKCDAQGRSIHAMAFDPNNRDATKVELTGWLDTASDGEKVIMLRSPQSAASIDKPAPRNLKPGDRSEDQSYCLTIRGDILWFYGDVATVLHNHAKLPLKPSFGFHQLFGDSQQVASTQPASTQPAQQPVFLSRTRTDSHPAAVDLIAHVDTKLDTISGAWNLSLGHLECRSGARAGLKLPYTPPDEYDLEIKFNRAMGNQALAFDFPAGSHSLRWVVSAQRNREAGFTEIDGKTAAVAIQHAPRWITNLQEYTVLVQVRSDKATVSLDGKVISEYSRDAGDASAQQEPNGTLAVSFNNSQVSINSMTLTEVRGQGKWIR